MRSRLERPTWHRRRPRRGAGRSRCRRPPRRHPARVEGPALRGRQRRRHAPRVSRRPSAPGSGGSCTCRCWASPTTRSSRYLYSKWRGEQAVRASSLDWVVLRPSLMFGEGDGFFNLVKTTLRYWSPGIVAIPGRGDARFQPLSVDDLAIAVEKQPDRCGPRRIGLRARRTGLADLPADRRRGHARHRDAPAEAARSRSRSSARSRRSPTGSCPPSRSATTRSARCSARTTPIATHSRRHSASRRGRWTSRTSRSGDPRGPAVDGGDQPVRR